jgi:MFS family permease
MATTLAAPAGMAVPRLRAYARTALLVMFGINFLNYLDRFILPSVLSSIQKEFSISDAQAGLLATAFTLVYALAALPFGVWADRGVRKNVIALGVGLWSLATFLTGMASSFIVLFLARAAVGVGEAGYYPAGTSLLVDYFPKEKRASVLGVWNVGASIGAAIGFAIGGLIAEHLGWRWAFYFTIIPGALFTLLAFRMREPRRGGELQARSGDPLPLASARTPESGADPVSSTTLPAHHDGASALTHPSDVLSPGTAPTPFSLAVREVLHIPTMRIALIAQTLNFFVLGAAVLWFPTLLQRRFTLSEGKAGAISGGVIILAGIVGTLGGAWIADRLLPRLPPARLLVTGAAFSLSAPLMLISLQAGSLGTLLPLFFLAGVCLQAYNGPMSALMQDVVEPRLRAIAVALSLIVAHVLGDAFSPALVGGLSDLLGNGHGDPLGHHLNTALQLTLPITIFAAGIVCFLGLRYVLPDSQAAEGSSSLRRP